MPQQKYRVKLSDGRTFDVTTDGGPPSEEEVFASLTQPQNPAADSMPDKPSTVGGLALASIAKGTQVASRLATEFATNPTVPAKFATGGRWLGGVTSLPSGLSGFGDVARGTYAGGRAGWFTGKLAQNMSVPVAKALETVTPYLKVASVVSGAQGALDLAQMADPSRKDLGVLGVGYGDPHADAAHPALLNLLAMKAQDAVAALAGSGLAKAEALKAYLTLKGYLGKATAP